ncbi:MAG TPA: NAD-dependent epimerase/dehydratase family protein [Mycobacteriales bacterium]|nr:NAD-dependent epimerase/dehydratase family protein [Mycobacteriales bacterium]
MKVLVTGGAGFIGANLCRRLAAEPEVTSVLALDNLSTGAAENLGGVDVRLLEGSILDPEALAEATAEADAIVHLAARPSVPRSLQDPVASHEANATGTLRVLEAARPRNVHVVLASSSSVYGANPLLPKSEDLATRPLSPYAVTKLATEAYAGAYAASFGLPTLAFRLFNVYGPLQPAGHAYAAVVPAFLDAALRGEPLTVYGDGKQSRDFTYVATVTEVLTKAVLRRVTAPGPVNLAFGTRTTLLELVALLGGMLGTPPALRHEEPRRGDVRDSQASQVLLRELFPDVSPTPLNVGLAETLAWFRTLAR